MAIGRQLLLDVHSCTSSVLTDPDRLEALMRRACEAAGATVLAVYVHKFPGPGGITVLVCLAESSADLHTYPELGQWFASVFTCGSADPELAGDLLLRELGGLVSRREVRARGVL